MERRDRSLKALNELIYIDSLDASARALGIVRWVETYLQSEGIDGFDLELNELYMMSELFYKNISFLKMHRKDTKKELEDTKKMRQFFTN